MMNIACSTCLESFTSGCDISTTPCGHVFHTGCITRWLDGNSNCSQCRKDCEISQIIKLYFSESQSALEEQITVDELEDQRLQMEEKLLLSSREVAELKKNIIQKTIDTNRSHQNQIRLLREKSLLKLNHSKVEWNLKTKLKKAKKDDAEKWTNRIKSYISATINTQPRTSTCNQAQPRTSSCKFVLLLFSAKINQKSIT